MTEQQREEFDKETAELRKKSRAAYWQKKK